MGRGRLYKTEKFDHKARVSGHLYDRLDANAETWQPVSVRDDPRLERDNSRDARPVDISRGQTWADAMRSKRRRAR